MLRVLRIVRKTLIFGLLGFAAFISIPGYSHIFKLYEETTTKHGNNSFGQLLLTVGIIYILYLGMLSLIIFPTNIMKFNSKNFIMLSFKSAVTFILAIGYIGYYDTVSYDMKTILFPGLLLIYFSLLIIVAILRHYFQNRTCAGT